jgi:hypothetical protein
MIDIAIEYPFLLFRRKEKGSFPESWAEVAERQFIAILKIINGGEPDFSFLSMLTGIRESLLQQLSPYQLLRVSEGLDFIAKGDNCHHSFFIQYISTSTLIAPKAKLEGVTFGQFIFADSYYNDWLLTKDDTTLNSFIASLYLLPGEKFNNAVIPIRSVKVANTDIEIRKAIAFNWSLVMAWLWKAYPLIFSEPVKETEKDGKPKQAVQSPWIKLFETLVGDDLINRDRYAELSVHTVFRHLTKKYKENARGK